MTEEKIIGNSKRLSMVRAELANWQVDAVLISSKSNRRWLSGFTGSDGLLLVSEDRALIGTDSRYWEQAEEQAPTFELYKFKGSRVAASQEYISQTYFEEGR